MYIDVSADVHVPSMVNRNLATSGIIYIFPIVNDSYILHVRNLDYDGKNDITARRFPF